MNNVIDAIKIHCIIVPLFVVMPPETKFGYLDNKSIKALVFATNAAANVNIHNMNGCLAELFSQRLSESFELFVFDAIKYIKRYIYLI
jgi:hypothetical protein